jgi:hypothetical protein
MHDSKIKCWEYYNINTKNTSRHISWQGCDEYLSCVESQMGHKNITSKTMIRHDFVTSWLWISKRIDIKAGYTFASEHDGVRLVLSYMDVLTYMCS